jgi:hypothetical protein
VDVGQLLVNFLDPTELNTAFHSSLLEHQVCLWVSTHQLQENLFLETLTISVGDTGSFVCLCGFDPKQNLIIAKEVRSVQVQVLILVFLAQRKSYFAFRYQEQFSECVTLLYDRLVWHKNAAVQMAHKLRDELAAAFKFAALVFVVKQMVKVKVYETLE